MTDDFDEWYVRDGSRVSGPFTREELTERRRRGELRWSQEVSRDGVVWVGASSLGPVVGPGSGSGRRAAPRGGRVPLGLAAVVVVGLLGFLVTTGPDEGDGPPPGPAPTVAEVPVSAPIEDHVPPPPPPPPPASRRTARVVRSADAVDEISGAVGLVVAGLSMTAPDGTRTEVPFTTGTCFTVSTRGYLLTNRHVVEGRSDETAEAKLRVKARGAGMTVEPGLWVFHLRRPSKTLEKRPARIVFQTAADDSLDVAVLKVEPGPAGLPCYFRLAMPGEIDGLKSREVYALGFPGAARARLSSNPSAEPRLRLGSKIEDLFAPSDFDYVPERGLVKVVREEDGPTRKAVEWILHGAEISHGNSGGPLVAPDGTAVGINTLIQHVKDDGVTNYFALGTSQVRDLLSERLPELAADLAPTADP